MVTLGQLLLSLSCVVGCLPTVLAPIWSCSHSDYSAEVYTNTPVSSLSSVCEPFPLTGTSFNKVSPEAFAALGGLGGGIVDNDHGRAMNGIQARPSSERATKKGTRAELLRRPPTTVPNLHVTWQASRTGQDESTRAERAFNEACNLSGKVFGDGGGRARIEITRGAVTKDYLDIQLRPGKQATAWEKKLRGACRDPQVRAVRINDG